MQFATHFGHFCHFCDSVRYPHYQLYVCTLCGRPSLFVVPKMMQPGPEKARTLGGGGVVFNINKRTRSQATLPSPASTAHHRGGESGHTTVPEDNVNINQFVW